MKKFPFFLPFGGCAGRCVYCNQQVITGVSTLTPPDEVARIVSALDEPMEICFFGGTFCRFERETVRAYLEAVKSFAPRGSRIRFSTYPGDLKDRKLLELIMSYNIACVELGVPSLDTAVLSDCRRGADPEEILSELAALHDECVPLGVQVMIGLPGQTIESSLSDIKRLASVKGAADWDLRIYPTLVLTGTELCNMMEGGKYTPLSLMEACKWGGRLLDVATGLGFRPIRVGLQESDSLAAQVRGGPYHPALGELITAESLARKLIRVNRRGPWTVPLRHISKLTGHGEFGARRMAFYSSLPEDEILNLIDFFPSR